VGAGYEHAARIIQEAECACKATRGRPGKKSAGGPHQAQRARLRWRQQVVGPLFAWSLRPFYPEVSLQLRFRTRISIWWLLKRRFAIRVTSTPPEHAGGARSGVPVDWGTLRQARLYLPRAWHAQRQRTCCNCDMVSVNST